MFEAVAMFMKENRVKDEIIRAGEQIMIIVYGGDLTQSIDDL